jgi:ligand-binding sensor domain-containing protein/two-component sensor histidine kinase
VKIHLSCLLLLLATSTFSQEYNYVHYDTKDGLAGSTVYRMCQDKKGYLWFATDNGVSMFDGKRFRNFTTEDGLTDNDVIFIASDSKGRVWMMPFNKTICFYYDGRIHNPKNDSSLSTVQFSSWVVVCGENKRGDVFLHTTEGLFAYTADGRLKEIADYKELAEKFHVNPETFFPINLYNNPMIRQAHECSTYLLNGDRLFALRADTFFFYRKARANIYRPYSVAYINENLDPVYASTELKLNQNSISYIGNYEWMFNAMDGAWKLDSTGNYDPVPYIPGKKISSSIRDIEGNLWFSTIGEGAYRLTSPAMKIFSNGHEAFCLEKIGDAMYAGFGNGELYKFRNNRIETIYPFTSELKKDISKRLYTLKKDNEGNLLMGFDTHVAKLGKNGSQFRYIMRSIKSFDIVDRNTFVASTNTFTGTFRSDDLTVIDTLWRDRATKVLYNRGQYYLGTLDGVVILDNTGRPARLGLNNPLLNKRIVDLCKMPDGRIWIATNDNGVLLATDQKIDTVFNVRNGLSSNICKSLFLKAPYIWVGTDKGINKIDINTKKVVARYSLSDGLASNIVNNLYVDDSLVWVCSPAGVTYFNEANISDSSICNLDLTAVNVSGASIIIPNHLNLPYKQNNISFEYAAISFKSAGDITYTYKLKGLNDNWMETRLTTLSYPSLPPGDYEFQLYATNKYGRKSEKISIPFSINTPFWRTIWFWVAASLLTSGIAWYLLSLRYKRLRKRLKEKNEIMNRMTELEQASLRAQMNPHFIFNCLNSIQHFILKDDLKQTNRYITQFGSLIRKTMDNSARAVISISDEINYLNSYLELEQMRFSSKFRYEISIDPTIDKDQTFIPSMLLQPFVENAIRHGIRNKQEGEGLIIIGIERSTGHLLINIEDNGVGREAAREYQGEQPIEYQSKGITLTQKRIDILNVANTEKVKTSIIDLKDENGYGKGTRVILSFPLSVIEKNSLL